MKTELEKFIKMESNGELQIHHLFLTQLFMLSKGWEAENEGKPLTVFQCLLQYTMEISNRNNPMLNEYMEVLNKKLS